MRSWIRLLFWRKKLQIVPKCASGYRWMVEATGQFRPCCWIDPRDFDDPEFNLETRSLNEVFQSKPFKEFLSRLKKYESAPAGCQRACGELSNRPIDFYGNEEKYGYARNMRVFRWTSEFFKSHPN